MSGTVWRGDAGLRLPRLPSELESGEAAQAEGPLEQRDAFHAADTPVRTGWLSHAGPMLDDAELAELRGELDEVLRRGPEGFGGSPRRPVLFRNLSGRPDAPVWQIVNMWEAAPAFERLIRHRGIVEAISQLTQMADLMVWHDQVQYKPARHGGATRWHQDAPLWPIIRPMTPVSAWLPFDDADLDNGCMWMVPGSHRWGKLSGLLPGPDAADRDFQSIGGLRSARRLAGSAASSPGPARCGPARCTSIIRSPGTGRRENRSMRPRRAIAIHYMTGEARFDASGNHAMKQFITLADGEPMSRAGFALPDRLARAADRSAPGPDCPTLLDWTESPTPKSNASSSPWLEHDVGRIDRPSNPPLPRGGRSTLLCSALRAHGYPALPQEAPVP